MITKGNTLDLLTNSLNLFFMKCIEIDVENLSVDIGA